MQLSRFVFKILYPKYIVEKRSASCIVLKNNIPNIKEEAGHTNCSALNPISEDVSSITPYFPQSFNLAAYVNSSESLKKLVQLDVNLAKIEKKPYIAEKLLKLDFEESIKRHLFFLKEFVDGEKIGYFLTRNPMILCEPLDDLKVRINYLQSKKFSTDEISRIVTHNPYWLMFSTKRIDKRLGFFQQKFELSGAEVRGLSATQPRIITYNLHHINTNTFVIKEEMGFDDPEVKQLILNKPKLWMISNKALLERFNYLHNVIRIPHSMLLKFPGVLLCRNFIVKQRHSFLLKLGRAQYDPQKENYIPILALVEDTDIEFCKKYAKCDVNHFNLFLKTI